MSNHDCSPSRTFLPLRSTLVFSFEIDDEIESGPTVASGADTDVEESGSAIPSSGSGLASGSRVYGQRKI